MTESELQKQVEVELAHAGIMPLVDRDKSQFLTALPDLFVEIVLTDASKQADAEQVLRDISGELKQSGTEIDVVVRSLWEVAKIWYMGPARSVDGGLRAALYFRAKLRSGNRETEVRVDVTIAALSVLRQQLGKGEVPTFGWSPQKGDVDEEDIIAAISRFLELQLDQGGTSYWDPLLDSHLVLNEPGMSYVLGHSAAFQELRSAIADAFSGPVRESFINTIEISGISMSDFERVLPDLSNMLGGAFRRGQRFSVSAREMFDSLSRAEQELLKRYFLTQARRIKEEHPHLIQQFPHAMAKL
jgi:hypothetical protein